MDGSSEVVQSPNSLLYLSGSSKGSPSSLVKSILGIIGVRHNLAPKFPVYASRPLHTFFGTRKSFFLLLWRPRSISTAPLVWYETWHVKTSWKEKFLQIISCNNNIVDINNEKSDTNFWSSVENSVITLNLLQSKFLNYILKFSKSSTTCLLWTI